MIRDEDLKHAIDYSEGQKQAAFSILGEIVNILSEFTENMRIIGGWVPSLVFPNCNHIGSIDVDVLLNQEKIHREESYLTIRRILEKNGYKRHQEKFFTFVKAIEIDGIRYDVDVDFLSGKYGGNGGTRSKHVDAIKTLPATGGNLAFQFPAQEITIEYTRPDGAKDFGHINVISIIPYLVMKAAALGRGKPKDAYDIYFTIDHFPGGVRELVKEFIPYKEYSLVKEMAQKLKDKFASIEHAGPMDIVSFLSIDDEEERIRIQQDAYQKISYLADSISQ